MIEVVIIKNHCGEIRNNTFGTPMKIVKYDDGYCDIEFLDEHHYIKKNQLYNNFRQGHVKNPYDRTMCGVGYIGIGRHMARNSETHKQERIYQIWSCLFDRCYRNPIKYPAYCDRCEICEEWQNYQTFADWYEENQYECEGRLHLNKDILCPSNTVYSPDKCLLVPQRINMLFANKPNNRGLPNGIRKDKNGYSAKYAKKELGTYKTIEEAYDVYAKTKEKAIKQVADEYREIIPEKVYKALYTYKVDIRNDKNYIC